MKVASLTEELRQFTTKELSDYDGKDGKPAYIAHKGRVYEVSNSDFWIAGEHIGTHQAGKDLTDEIALAPHNGEVLERTKLVGVLI